MPTPLPLPWVEKIFQKLSLVYGRDFLGKWEGIPLEEVKADWAHELAGLDQRPEMIKHALTHLPARAPNVLEFRSLALLAPMPAAPRLERPKVNPEIARAAIAEARALLTRLKS